MNATRKATTSIRRGRTGWKATKTTSATGNSALRSGFTLIELSIVIFIAAVVTAIGIPYFVRTFNGMQFSQAGRNFITACQYARSQAVLRQAPATLHLDIEGQRYWVAQRIGTEAGIGESPTVLKMFELPRQAALVSAQVGEEPPRQRGVVEVVFYPNGTCDAFALVLRGVERADAMSLVVDPVTARATPGAVKP